MYIFPCRIKAHIHHKSNGLQNLYFKTNIVTKMIPNSNKMGMNINRCDTTFTWNIFIWYKNKITKHILLHTYKVFIHLVMNSFVQSVIYLLRHVFCPGTMRNVKSYVLFRSCFFNSMKIKLKMRYITTRLLSFFLRKTLWKKWVVIVFSVR